MARRVYVGSIDEIVTQLDGIEMTVARGDVVDVSDDEASRLDQQPSNWATPKSGGKTPPKSKDGE